MAASFSSGYKAEYIALLNETETKLKVIVKEGVLKGDTQVSIEIAMLKVIKQFERSIPKTFYERDKMIKSLLYTKDKWLKEFTKQAREGYQRAKAQLEGVVGKSIKNPQEFLVSMMQNLYLLKASEIADPSETGITVSFTSGFPYVQNYYENVMRAVNNLAEDYVKEPPTPGKKKTALALRSMVEIAIRGEFHNDQLNEMRARGVKIARVSSHADCSSRCEPYQNHLYSLDKTSGVVNGERYVPIEKATDVFSITRNGRKWKNGLFGFNCRHRLIEYRENDAIGIDYTHEEMVKEREVSAKQREMERMVYKLRQEAILHRGDNPKLARTLNVKATRIYKQYQAYSRTNDRAFYPQRCQVSQTVRGFVQDAQLRV